jgi:formylglycine-generating enzyme required for sulfatase activity
MPPVPSFNEDWRLGEHPIVNVTWFDAKAYCEWAGGRLPTEAEWERAARATHDWEFVWGDQVVPLIDGKAQANVPDVSYVRVFGERKQSREMETYDDGFAATAPIGTFPPNDFGLYDMAGNVAEWVQDETIMPSRFRDESEGYEGRPTDGRAWEGGDGFVRVFRGGHWGSSGPVWMRDPGTAYGKFDGLGFRCVRENLPDARPSTDAVPGSAERTASSPR